MSHVVCIVYSLLSIIQNDWTALMEASNEDHTEVVKVLVEAKADLYITDQVNLIINCLLTLTTLQKKGCSSNNFWGARTIV